MNWKTIRRETGLIEHVCEHGIGHPNGASIKRMQFLTGQESWGVHGCCACCQLLDFPGNVYNNLTFAFHRYIVKILKTIDSEKTITGFQYLLHIDGPVALYLDNIYEFSIYEELSLEDQIDCAQLDMMKLKEYILKQPDSWHENYRQKAEFMYWPLKQLEFKNV